MKLTTAVALILLSICALHSCSSGTGENEAVVQDSQSATSSNEQPKATGTTINIKGRAISLNDITAETRQLSDSSFFEKSQLRAIHHKQQKTIPFTNAPKEISFGKGNFLPIIEIPIGKPLKHQIEPVIVQALPFQNVLLEKLSYHAIGLSQGLKSAFVTAVFEDSRGYFWFGGRRGVTRYDGQTFYFYPFANEGQHRGIGAITEDGAGNIWMSFGSFGGLMKFDGHHFYEFEEGAGLDLGEEYLGIIHSDKKGNVWLKSETKVIRFDGTTFTCFPYQFQNLKNLNVIIKENDEGTFWLSALGGVCSLDGEVMKYYAIEEESENNLCHPIMEDERGLLVATGSGISILKDNELHVFPSQFIEKNSIRNTLAIGADFMLVSESRMNAICSIQDSTLKVVSEKNAVLSGAFPLYVDRFHNVWLGTAGKGIICYNPYGFKHFKFEDQSGSSPISAITEDSQGNVWFGSHGFGLFKYDGQLQHYYPLLEDNWRITIRSLLEDSNGNVWVGTMESGLFKVAHSQDSGITVTRYNCFGDDNWSVFSLIEDEWGNIWIGTRARGLMKFDGSTFTQYETESDDPANSINTIRALLIDSKKNLWIGSQSEGVRTIALGDIDAAEGLAFKGYSESDGLSSDHVVSLIEDKDGAIWLGTSDGGLNRFDGNKFEHLSIKDGLSSDAIWTLSKDAEDNLWVGADNCLDVLVKDSASSDINQYRIKSFCNLNGLEGAEFYANSGIRDRRDRMWWGTDQMAVMLSSTNELIEQSQLQLSLEQLNIANKNVNFRALQDSSNTANSADFSGMYFAEVLPFVNCPAELELPPHLNDVRFIYSAKGANKVNKVFFSFFMEGVDKDWSVPSENNQIDYRGLEAGTYTLKTRVNEGRGIMSEPHEYTFTVLPFWYQTLWARCIWGLMALVFIYGVYRVVDFRRREREEARRIKEIEAMKSMLYANITHEFRTPLTLIMGMNDKIEEHEKETSIIRRNSQKLLHQINQLLDTARLESGSLTLNIVQRDMVEYLKFLTESFYTLAESKSITLTFYAEESSLMMDFDEEKMQEIVYNLLSNAIKFTPTGGTIVFHVSKVESNLRLKVKDSGIGMTAAQLEKIFDRFYQVNDPKATVRRGTGIGLALTKDLIALMNGEITATSTVDEGTEFLILLPITNEGKISTKEGFAKSLGLERETEVVKADEQNINEENADKTHLLIIEDNLEIAQFLADMLQNDYIIHIAENGRIGIEKALEVIPDAIISDVNMPEKDGYEVCEALKGDSKTSHIPIILLTANTAQRKKLEGYIYGADAYITKPFQREELEIRLQNLIDQRKELQKYYLSLATSAQTVAEEGEEISPEEAFLNDLKSILEEHYQTAEFGVPELAEKAGVSKMQVYRKLKALTDKTPSQFIRSYRLHKAMELLKKGDLNVSEIAYEVGFSDPNYFSRTFHKEFGNPPGYYLK